MCESLRKLVNIGSFNILQDKLDGWLENYNYNTCDQNVARGCEIIELNAKIQGQLFKLLSLCASEGGVYGGASVIKNRLLPILGKGFFSSGLSVDSSMKVLEDVGSNKKGLKEIKRIYEKSLDDLDFDLRKTKRENDSLKLELEETKIELERQESQSTSDKMFDKREISDLKNQLENIKSENSSLKLKALKTDSYKHEIDHLKEDVAHLTSHRSAHCLHSHSHCHSPRSHSPCDPFHIHGCPLDTCCKLSSIEHCDMICQGKEQHLVTKINDLFSINRIDAMNTLGRYSEDHENNQKILFHSVMESFNAAKSAFRSYKSRVRTDLICHSHGCSLEDSVQHYINKHSELDVDATTLCREVVRALEFKVPLIQRPAGLSFDVIGSFIREACRIAWEMCSLPTPIDVYHPTSEGELFDEIRYRKSYDSEYSAAFVSHHIWPCLVKNGVVIVKGEAVTKRGGSLSKTSRTGRSPTRSPTRLSGRSPSPSFMKSKSPIIYRSTSPTLRRLRNY